MNDRERGTKRVADGVPPWYYGIVYPRMEEEEWRMVEEGKEVRDGGRRKGECRMVERGRQNGGWWTKYGRSEVLPFEFIDVTIVKRECVRYKFRIVSTLFGCGK